VGQGQDTGRGLGPCGCGQRHGQDWRTRNNRTLNRINQKLEDIKSKLSIDNKNNNRD
jgi:hypothetical protein